MINRDRPWWVLDLWARWCGWFGHRFEQNPLADGRTCRRCLEFKPTYKQLFDRIIISPHVPPDHVYLLNEDDRQRFEGWSREQEHRLLYGESPRDD